MRCPQNMSLISLSFNRYKISQPFGARWGCSRFRSALLSLMMPFVTGAAIVAGLSLLSSPVYAQVTLKEMQDAAVRRDPRTSQRNIQDLQTQLRLKNIRSEWYPEFMLEAKAQYQSSSATLPGIGPGGAPVSISQDKDSYDTYVGIQQKILDFTAGRRSNLERARLVEAQSGIQTNLYRLKEEVNTAYFNAVVIQNRIQEVELAVEDLLLRLSEAESRVRQGASTAGEPATIKVGVLQLRQELLKLESVRKAALAVLNELTGSSLDSTVTLQTPSVSGAVDAIRSEVSTLRSRPEFEQFSASRSKLQEDARLIESQDRPRLFGFGRVGYGRPGLNFLNDKFDSYWLAGVQFQWKPFNWGATGRDKQVVRLQQQFVDAEELALSRAITRASEIEFSTIDEITQSLKMDEEIVQLRELVEKEARSQFENGVLTASEYLSRRTELLQARVGKSVRSVELAQSQAKLLNILGIELK